MSQTIFRKKSIERISSPEQLNDYIRVSNPGVWIILSAIVLLLVGVCVWGVLGHLDTKLPVAAVVEDGRVTVYVKEDEAVSVEKGMTVYIGQEKYQIAQIPMQPVAITPDFSEYALHIGSLQVGQWVYPMELNGTCPDGIYQAEIIIESVSPMSFILN